MTPQTNVSVPLADMLARVANELTGCRASLLVIEELIQPELTAKGRPLLSKVKLQDIDMLAQVLGELAGCLSGVAIEVLGTDTNQIDVSPALDSLRLEGLRRRLAGVTCNPANPEPVELF
jgi:hypothetical protein